MSLEEQTDCFGLGTLPPGVKLIDPEHESKQVLDLIYNHWITRQHAGHPAFYVVDVPEDLVPFELRESVNVMETRRADRADGPYPPFQAIPIPDTAPSTSGGAVGIRHVGIAAEDSPGDDPEYHGAAASAAEGEHSRADTDDDIPLSELYKISGPSESAPDGRSESSGPDAWDLPSPIGDELEDEYDLPSPLCWSPLPARLEFPRAPSYSGGSPLREVSSEDAYDLPSPMSCDMHPLSLYEESVPSQIPPSALLSPSPPPAPAAQEPHLPSLLTSVEEIRARNPNMQAGLSTPSKGRTKDSRRTPITREDGSVLLRSTRSRAVKPTPSRVPREMGAPR
jgi:hypothetical protein